MKKLFYVFCTLLLTFVSCQKEAIEQNSGSKVLTLNATMEKPVDATTKTYLDGVAVKWMETDEIIVFDINGHSTKLKVQEIKNEGISADFVEDTKFRQADFDDANLKCACYPYPENGEIVYDNSSESIAVTLPDEQRWDGSESFGQNTNYSAGIIEDGHVVFKNLCGVLKLDVTGTGLLGDVILEGLDVNTSICGEYTVSLVSIAAGEPELQPTTTGCNSLTLHCGGAYLTSEKTSMYIILPAGSFAGTSGNPGFKVTFKNWITASGETASFQSSSDQNTIVRSQIKVMPAIGNVVFNIPELSTAWTPEQLPNGYTDVDWIAASGKGYIDTRIEAGRDDILLDYTYTNGNVGFGVETASPLSGPSVESYNMIRSWYGSNIAGTTSAAGRYLVHWDPRTGVVTRNGDSVLTLTPQEKNERSELTLTVLCKNKHDGLTSYGTGMKVRYLRVLNTYVENRTLFLGVPAKRNSDNVFGLYDFVTGTFFTNANSVGAITGGNDE